MEHLLLEIKDLNIALLDGKQAYPAVDHLYLKLRKGETIGIIGESGSGKSISCMAAMGLLDLKKWKVSGQVYFNGQELPIQQMKRMRAYCGSQIAMVMQNPMSAFDPSATIRTHFIETVRSHRRASKEEIEAEAVRMLLQLHLDDPRKALNSYPFQCSGGMLQRIMIAMALLLEPEVLIADEPTTALDRTIQHEIIRILEELKSNRQMSMILVSHDLGVMDHLADYIYVMYSGQMIECAPTQELLENPLHPYTRGLLQSRPRYSKERLMTMEGNPPSLMRRRAGGCVFWERCAQAQDQCRRFCQQVQGTQEHFVSCAGVQPSKMFS